MMVFPVAAEGKPTFRNDWGEPRGGGTRGHKGTDIFAARGTPVRAVADGTARTQSETLGGNALYLVDGERSQFYYAHLDGYAGEFPRKVRAGEVVAFVGNTGNAANGPTHLHFEWRPFGGEKANPFDELARLARGAGTALARVVTPARAGRGAAGLGLLVLLWAATRRRKR